MPIFEGQIKASFDILNRNDFKTTTVKKYKDRKRVSTTILLEVCDYQVKFELF